MTAVNVSQNTFQTQCCLQMRRVLSPWCLKQVSRWTFWRYHRLIIIYTVQHQLAYTTTKHKMSNSAHKYSEIILSKEDIKELAGSLEV